jgi:phenylpropionate dioxygenase-like ring-hydroxylating dioxygenase large terminal subunit
MGTNPSFGLDHVGGRPGYAHLVTGDYRVHRTAYVDPAVFEAEMTRIFGGTWVYLLHESEIPDPGSFRTLRVGLRPVIVTRGDDGAVHALLNRCSHRGAVLCTAPAGTARRFQCAYHGWTFASDGRLSAIPYADGYRDSFDRAAYGLRRFPRVESYRGFVFGSLRPDVQPVTDWLGSARDVLDWAIDSLPPARMLRAATFEYHGNWKLQNDNNGDMFHTPFTHRSTLTMTRQRHGDGKLLDHFTGDKTPMAVRSFGHGHKMIDQRPSIPSAWARTRPLPGSENEAARLEARLGAEQARRFLDYIGQSGINLVIYPNLHVRGNGSLYVYEPVAVDRTLVHTYVALLHGGPPEVNTLRMRFAEDFVNLGNRDDSEVFERVQDGLAHGYESEWVDVSKGWQTGREYAEAAGSLAGNVSDETGVRAAYDEWRRLMSAAEAPAPVARAVDADRSGAGAVR